MQMEMEQKIMEAKVLEDKLSRMKQLREMQQGEFSNIYNLSRIQILTEIDLLSYLSKSGPR